MKTQLILLLAAVIAGEQACRAQQTGPREQRVETRDAAAGKEPAAMASAPGSYADIVARVAPAVVTIRSERRQRTADPYRFQLPDSLRELFGDRFGPGDAPSMPRNPVQRGLGSGVIVGDDGRCLTNHHVVDGAEDIRVELADGRSFKAQLVGSDPPSDLAVLKIEPSGLPVLGLGNSDAVRVGDIALAIGNPLGVGQTVTAGIISAKNRTSPVGEGSFEDFLQTDAPINQGNSGGALINTAGELIGINSQIVSVSGGNIGIGFAIPSNMARNVMDQLTKNGRVRRGQLGIGIQPLTPEISSALGLRDVRGVLINSVTAGSPAEQAGLRRGDVITRLDGQPVTDGNALRNRIASAGPGAEVALTVVRQGKEQELRAKLGEYESASGRTPTSSGSRPGTGRLGITVEPVTPEAAARLRIPANEGLLIGDVEPDGPGASAGLLRGDVILEVNRKPVRSVSDLEGALTRDERGSNLMLINRRGQTVFLAVPAR